MSYFTPIYNSLTIIGIPILLYFIYFGIVGIIGFRKYEKFEKTTPKNKFTAVIAARNESNVIGELIDSIKNTNYPNELLDVWVIPNNCTDNTEGVAREHGAKIYNPKGEIHSKGEALKEYFDYILNTEDYDAFCIFDADNLVDPDFFNRMNDVIESGEEIAQGYRESKNPKDSWISGSQTIFYWITNRFLNGSKRNLGMSAVLNGTGFMVKSDLLREMGFDTFTMTEDIEFSTQCILKGHRIAFVSEAKIYDEHPIDFKTSWNQRKRWSTGIIQVLYNYSDDLFKKFKETKKWIYFDMILYLVAPYFQVLGICYTIATLLIYGLISNYVGYMVSSFSFSIFINLIGIVLCFLYCLFITKLEHHKLSSCIKDAYIGFWWFMMSWTFINIQVFFRPITTWEPIEHNRAVSLTELQTAQAQE